MSEQPARTPLALFQEFGTPVYPGHPIALACYALITGPTIADALVPSGPTGHTLATAKTVAASAESVQATASMLGRLQRGESLDAAVKWANDQWARAIRGHKPAFDARLEPGNEQARRMEPLFRELVIAARARAAEIAAANPPAPAPGEAPATGEAAPASADAMPAAGRSAPTIEAGPTPPADHRE
jgi:hypothetical protein